MNSSKTFMHRAFAALLSSLSLGACVIETGEKGDDNGSTMRRCAGDNGSLDLPPGFCATIFAEDLGKARHITVSPGGIVFVATADGGVIALRDDDDDGVADHQSSFGDAGGNGIAWHDGHLYFAQDEQIVRWALADDEMTPNDNAEIVVSGLVATGDHSNKSITIANDGALLVNIGSATNACQLENREPGSLGIDPCPELAIRAGIWRFVPGELPRVAPDGDRYASGIRNAVALAIEPLTGALVTVSNGRDQLYENWPELYSAADDLRLPSEELRVIEQGADYGWPYCYHDPDLGRMLLAPEYGGDGLIMDRCADVVPPEQVFGAHWAPLGMHFYGGRMFPSRYRGGAFVAFHGSRFAPNATGELPGYSVMFVPFDGGEPTGGHETFATDFAGNARPLPDEAEHRPVGLAEAPDGSLYIGDDHGGRIWRVYYDEGTTP